LRPFEERLPNVRLNIALLVLISLSILVGVIGGLRSNLTAELLFRLLVLSNLALLAYIVLLKNVVAGLIIYLYSLVFLNYYWRIIIPGTWPDLDIPRIVFVFVWMIFLLELALGRKRLLPNTPVGTMMLLMLGALVFNMVTNGISALRQFLNGYAIPYAMFVISKNVFTERRQVERLAFWLAVPLALYFPATAIFEHYRLTALIFPRYIGQSMSGGTGASWGVRAMGTFLQPVATGFAMIATFVLALHVLSRSRRALSRVYMLLITLITPIAVFFTYTRSVYLGFAAAVLVLIGFSRRLRVVMLVLMVAIGLGVMGNWTNVTSEKREAGGVAEFSTAQARIVLAQASLAMFLDHPFTGVGFTSFVSKAQPYVARVRWTFLGYKEAWIAGATNQHNQFLSVLTEIGLIGFVPFALLYFFVLRTLFKARSVAADIYDSEFVIAVGAIMAAYIAQIVFIEPRFFEFMNTLPFMLVGIVAGGYQRAMIRLSGASNHTDN
jgi:hypothetical protein